MCSQCSASGTLPPPVQLRHCEGFSPRQSLVCFANARKDDFNYTEFRSSSPKNWGSHNANGIEIILSGNSKDIPYNESNLIYKAAIKFFEKAQIKNIKLSVYIEKNIPVSAGLAGGSTNAAGTFYALNKMFDEPLNCDEINILCASLGSDLNFCLNGGCAYCTSRGEIIEKIPFFQQYISLIKPKTLGISAKEAYTKFSLLENKDIPHNSKKLKKLLMNGIFDKNLLYNSLEYALFPSYPELQVIKNKAEGSLMSGSGSVFFQLSPKIQADLDRRNYDIYENLQTINSGVEEVYE
ncbi:MAG: hypothetical protein LUG16_07110 [Candidatus Gastranaerophilales bacterium]|nr:hypothetical protein [Candidatus Gastranaerophilales bacterium]